MIEMTKEIKEYVSFRRKLTIINYARDIGSNIEAIRTFKISRSTFYKWKKAFDKDGPQGLLRKKPIANTHPNKIKPDVVEKVLKLRKEYQLGSWRIKWYLERYHGIVISESSVYRILKKHKVERLHKHASRRTVHTKRYSKLVPGHHVQVDVKFLNFKSNSGRTIKRFQYTAIDDATRVRALKIYQRHTQVNAIDFIDYVVGKSPFRINTIRTDRGHEFQAKFHWHVEDQGMRHQYIKAGTPQLNGKVERSHLTDQREFYQLLTYTDDVDLNKKLNAWEHFYNFDRPHGSFKGKTPYEILKLKLTK
jgi:transposase